MKTPITTEALEESGFAYSSGLSGGGITSLFENKEGFKVFIAAGHELILPEGTRLNVNNIEEINAYIDAYKSLQ